MVELIAGDCREVLRILEAESVHCCVTSPPYWGLRDYGTKPSVWGGDADCEHEWQTECIFQEMRRGINLANSAASTRGGAKKIAKVPNFRIERSFCSRCSAWRGSLGLEPTPELYVEHLCSIFSEVRRVLRSDGTLWLNLGDCYANTGVKDSSKVGGFTGDRIRRGVKGIMDSRPRQIPSGLKPKDLVLMPYRVASALQAAGWWLRQDIIWAKKNCMPESVRDRPTSSHEHVFLLSKSKSYSYDQDAVREPRSELGCGWHKSGARDSYNVTDRNDGGKLEGERYPAGRNLRSVWHIATQPFPEAHFATFPEKLAEPCVKAGTSEKGCCASCGKSWERVVEKTNYNPEVVSVGARNVDESRGDKTRKLSGTEYNKQVKRTTLGFQPACSCNAGEPTPCTVLDPFIGSGTTALVAEKLGRNCIGIDVKQSYLDMAEKRLRKELGFLCEIKRNP